MHCLFQLSPTLYLRCLRHVLYDGMWKRYGSRGLADVESWIEVDDRAWIHGRFPALYAVYCCRELVLVDVKASSAVVGANNIQDLHSLAFQYVPMLSPIPSLMHPKEIFRL